MKHFIIVVTANASQLAERDDDFRLRLWKLFKQYPSSFEVNPYCWIISSDRASDAICEEIEAVLELPYFKNVEIIVAEVAAFSVLTKVKSQKADALNLQVAGAQPSYDYKNIRFLNKQRKRLLRKRKFENKSTGESFEQFMASRGLELFSNIHTNIRRPYQGGSPGLGNRA